MMTAMVSITATIKTAGLDWVFVLISLAGFAVGLIYRMAALIALSVVCLIVALPLSLIQGWSAFESILMLFGLLASAQFGYLSGVGAISLMKRVRGKCDIRSLDAASLKHITSGRQQ